MGLWLPASVQAIVVLLTSQAHTSTAAQAARDTRLRSLRSLAYFGTTLMETAASAWFLNFFLWFIMNILFYESTMEAAMFRFDQQVNDIFGLCVSGFGPKDACTTFHGVGPPTVPT